MGGHSLPCSAVCALAMAMVASHCVTQAKDQEQGRRHGQEGSAGNNTTAQPPATATAATAADAATTTAATATDSVGAGIIAVATTTEMPLAIAMFDTDGFVSTTTTEAPLTSQTSRQGPLEVSEVAAAFACYTDSRAYRANQVLPVRRNGSEHTLEECQRECIANAACKSILHAQGRGAHKLAKDGPHPLNSSCTHFRSMFVSYTTQQGSGFTYCQQHVSASFNLRPDGCRLSKGPVHQHTV